MDTKRWSKCVGALVFAMALGFSTSAAAKTFMIGGKVGGNLATVVGDDSPDNTSRLLGFSGGAVAALNFGSFGLQPELLYTVKGVETESSAGGVSVEQTRRFNYAQIPILLRYNVSVPGAPITPKVLLGPSISFFLDGENDVEGATGGGNVAIGGDIDSSEVRSPYFDGIFGLGVDIGLGPGTLLADVRVEQSLQTIGDSDNNDGDPLDQFHNSITAHVGFALGF